MIFTRLIPILLVLVTACGKNIEVSNKDQKVISTTYSNSPILLKLQDGQCLSSKVSLRNSAYKLYIYLNGRHEAIDKKFYSSNNGSPLRNNSSISNTYYGEEVETLYAQGMNQNRVDTDREELNLCSSTNSYSPLTLESVALNAAYYINKTKIKFAELFPQIFVAPVILNILPKLKKSFIAKNMSGETIKISTYLTDNAFYMGRDSSITFLPHSVDMKKMGFSANLWEVPMVISHEYGHHLFQTIFKGQSDSMGVHNCFGIHAVETPIKNKSLSSREVDIPDILSAYNEAFADIVAFYSLDAEYSLSGVRCLESTRDINSNTFYNGSLKVFGKRAIDSFFSDLRVTSSSCESVNFQEPHTLGAIFAYSANSYMDLFSNSKDKKFDVIVNWVNYLAVNQNQLSKLTPEEYLKESFSVFLRIATTRLDGSFTSKACKKIDSMYPDLEFKECL